VQASIFAGLLRTVTRLLCCCCCNITILLLRLRLLWMVISNCRSGHNSAAWLRVSRRGLVVTTDV
jgi:hypothetical protein